MIKKMSTPIDLRIKSIEVKNFKSLVDFRLDLSKFSCLIGLNGSGKSTVLQFIDFLAQLVRGNMSDWLEERGWKPRELRSKLVPRLLIHFSVIFENRHGVVAGRWDARYNPAIKRCIFERIDLFGYVLETSGGKATILIKKNKNVQKFRENDINFTYEGSILSSLKEEWLTPSILACKRFFLNVESLETLTPERLRKRTREANGSLGHGGRNLSAFIYELGTARCVELKTKLAKCYPHLIRIFSKKLRSGWKQLRVIENYRTPLIQMGTDAAHINDGLLRVLAILAELASEHGFLLFDEIENGVNPEMVEFIVDELVGARQQILVTTHSPMILNFLEDEIAKAGVIYLYKTKQGHTKSIPFFTIPSLKEKLQVMGPGEAFVDTELTKLAAEIGRMQKNGE